MYRNFHNICINRFWNIYWEFFHTHYTKFTYWSYCRDYHTFCCCNWWMDGNIWIVFWLILYLNSLNVFFSKPSLLVNSNVFSLYKSINSSFFSFIFFNCLFSLINPWIVKCMGSLSTSSCNSYLRVFVILMDVMSHIIKN